MSVKNRTLSFCKLFSFYEEISEEFLDETDVDFYFYHNIFDTSQSEHRIVRVSRGSNKKSFAIKLLQFCDLKTRQRYIVQEEVINSKKENSLVWPTICAIFSKVLIKPASAYRLRYQNPKLRLDPRSQKTISFVITITISLNIQSDKFIYHSVWDTTILAFLSPKSLNYTAINLFLQKLSTLAIVKFTISS